MGKKQKKVTTQKQYTSTKVDRETEGGNGLKSLLDDSIWNKLKDVASDMKQAEEKKQQKQLEEDAALKKAEQKRLEQDFAYLLENSDPKANKYK